MKIAVAFGIIVSLLFPVTGMATENFGAIQGKVLDPSGTPVVGALVIVVAATSSLGERMAFTDNRGSYSIPNLLVGEYIVKVKMSRYLPVVRTGIPLSKGTIATLNLDLKTAIDVHQTSNDRPGKNVQDIVWILRSSRAAQPALRLVSGTAPEDDWHFANYTGFVQLYSKSVELSGGSADWLGSRFSLTMPLQNQAKVTVDGLYNESPGQPRGLSTTYEFAPSDAHQSRVSLNMRQSALADGGFPGEELKEIQLKYSDKFQFLHHLVLNFGTETGRTSGSAGTPVDHYFRPTAGFSFAPDSKTTIGAAATAQSPDQADDSIRGKDYFEQQAFRPSYRQKYRHAEVNASHVVDGSTTFSAALFSDQSTSPALFIMMPDGERSVLVLDGVSAESRGGRVYVDRQFNLFSAGVGYSVASGLGLQKTVTSVSEIRDQLLQRQFHVFTARIKTDVELTNTEVTAVYHWISPLALVAIDPYQSNVEYNDPSLSITVAQTLPTFGSFPGKVQAILDARNLLEQFIGNRGAQISNSPRFVKGGINIRF